MRGEVYEKFSCLLICSVCVCVCVCVCVLFTQSCLSLSDPMDCDLPGSSIHGILQVRILKWVAIPFSSNCSINTSKYQMLLIEIKRESC